MPASCIAPQRAECERLLTAAAFASCQGLVSMELHVQACMQDRCHCPQNASCICSTIAEFSRQCSHAGGRPENWRTDAFCRKRRAGTAAGGRRGLTGVDPGNVLVFVGAGQGGLVCPGLGATCVHQTLHGVRRARPLAQGSAFACPAKSCPGNMVYLESGSPCMDTCSHLEVSNLCEEHRMDGCFCPEGEDAGGEWGGGMGDKREKEHEH